MGFTTASTREFSAQVNDTRLYFLRKPVEVVEECANLIEHWSADPITRHLVVLALRRVAEAMKAGKTEIEPY